MHTDDGAPDRECCVQCSPSAGGLSAQPGSSIGTKRPLEAVSDGAWSLEPGTAPCVNPTGYATKKRSDHVLTALKDGPMRGDTSRRHGVSRRLGRLLADVVRMPDHAIEQTPADAPRVQSNFRVVLSQCLGALGWTEGTGVRVLVADGTVTLSLSETNPSMTVGVRHQLTLTVPVRQALGMAAGDTVVAVANPVSGTLRLLGAAALADTATFTSLARPCIGHGAISGRLRSCSPEFGVAKRSRTGGGRQATRAARSNCKLQCD